MNSSDKNRQVIIYITCIIAVLGLCLMDKIKGEYALGIVTSIITYTAGRFTPYDNQK